MASFCERYHEFSKYNPWSIKNQGQPDWDEQPVPFKMLEEGAESISLLDHLPFLEDNVTVSQDWIPSIPDSEGYGSLTRLAHLLYFSGGITRVHFTRNGPVYFRANPSAGGLYPVEIYFAVRDWEGLEDGLYHFHPLLCSAVNVRYGNHWDFLEKAFFEQEAIGKSKLVMLYTGVMSRSVWRYRERSYRRTLIDTGCALGNTLLQCEYHRFKGVLLGGFSDNALRAYLDFPDDDELPIAAAAIAPADYEGESSSHAAGPRPGEICVKPESLQALQNQVERLSRALRPRQPKSPEGIPREMEQECIELKEAPLEPKGFFDDLPSMFLRRKFTAGFTGEAFPAEDVGALLQLCTLLTDKFSLPVGLLRWRLAVFNLDGIEPGVYRYDGDHHRLIREGDVTQTDEDPLQKIALGQENASGSSVALIYSADLDYATLLYGERVYRYLHVEAGMVSEYLNIFTPMFAGAFFGMSGFFDDMATEIFNLPKNEAVLYLAAIGYGTTEG